MTGPDEGAARRRVSVAVVIDVVVLLDGTWVHIGPVIVAFSHLFFNVSGILLIYPVPFIRGIPIFLARRLADLTSRSRVYAFAYVALVFYLVPLILIFIWR